MPRQKTRPSQADLDRAFRAFAKQGMTPRIVMDQDGLTVIESAEASLSRTVTVDDKLDAEMKQFRKKHCES